MENYSVDKNRVIAFIYIEGEFYSHKYHTECITQYLIKKELIKKHEDLYKMLSDKMKEPLARSWINTIEKNCIYGELSEYNGDMCMIIFDELTEYGIKRLEEKGYKEFGVKKIYYAKYLGQSKKKFKFIRLN